MPPAQPHTRNEEQGRRPALDPSAAARADLQDRLRAQFGVHVTQWSGMAGGRNNRLFRLATSGGPPLVAKFYHQDRWDRLGHEFGTLALPHPLWRLGRRAEGAEPTLLDCRPGARGSGMVTSQRAESFRGLLLRHRGRTGLTQRELAARAGVSRRTVQEWETGANYPGAERLEALIRVLLEAGGLTPGHEAAEAHVLWSAALGEAPRMRTPLDQAWLARLLAERATPAGAPEPARASIPAMPIGSRGEPRPVERRQDWGEAPDTVGFVDRTGELALLRHWVLNERCRLVALLGMGGIGKTSLAARVAQDVASNFERVYWRSLRDAPPVGEWLSGAIGLLSDRTLVPPSAESERIAMLLQLLRERRCLLVLDNSEALFEPGQREGRYRTGMTGYGRLLQAVGDASHQSCLVLTSREAPPELALLGGAARTFELGGFGADDAQVLLAPKQLEGTSQQWVALNARFGGNGLALKMVGESV
ncbi:MAG TPA: NACHT domain-containing protein, partial [Chloroflexota bacterium]|nr:NACHT domain-containing protein [Chloroflexota bacterium]